MTEKILTLKADIGAELNVIDQIYTRLNRQGDDITHEEQAIVIGYSIICTIFTMRLKASFSVWQRRLKMTSLIVTDGTLYY